MRSQHLLFFLLLTTGQGHTWLAILAVHPQRVGLKDVNSFFGNLRNGGKYEGTSVKLLQSAYFKE